MSQARVSLELTPLSSCRMVREMINTFEYKLRVNKKFVSACEEKLEQSRFVYNCALEHFKLNYQQKPYAHYSISYPMLSRELTAARRELPEVGVCLRMIQTDALERFELAKQAFFRRVRNGEKPGYPRFKSRDRYHTFAQKIEPQRGCPLKGDKLMVPGVGTCRVRLSRRLEGTVKQLRITRRADGWFALLVCEMEAPAPLPKTGDTVGIDVGLEYFATLSTGEVIENPRHLRKTERELNKASRRVSRRKKGGSGRKKAILLLRKAHLRVQRRRKDHHYKAANKIVKEFDVIAVEDLKIKNMVRNPHLAKSISDAGWGQFLAILSVKAESAGREFEKVSPAYTSQDCSQCGERVRLSLATRTYRCLVCNFEAPRDCNAALNVRARALGSNDRGSNQRADCSAPSAMRGEVGPARDTENRGGTERVVTHSVGRA